MFGRPFQTFGTNFRYTGLLVNFIIHDNWIVCIQETNANFVKYRAPFQCSSFNFQDKTFRRSTTGQTSARIRPL